MSSLALYASPYNNDNSTNNQIEKRRTAKNKTLKKRQNSENNNVATMISQIHEASELTNSNLGDYNPPSPPESVGAMRVDDRQNIHEPRGYEKEDKPVTIESYTGLESSQAEDYYKLNAPYYTKMSNNTNMGSDELMSKLDHILHLLEEQQEEKTGHVTEELILYSFLGIFIIFVIDSFARVGKYVR